MVPVRFNRIDGAIFTKYDVKATTDEQISGMKPAERTGSVLQAQQRFSNGTPCDFYAKICMHSFGVPMYLAEFNLNL